MGRHEDLVALDEEVSCLEVHIQEVEAGKRAVESLDAEAAEAAEAAQRAPPGDVSRPRAETGESGISSGRASVLRCGVSK